MTKLFALLVFSAALCALPLRAQTVRGTFVDLSGGPVVGARAILRDTAGREVAAAHAGPDGAFTLRAPAAGSYVVRVERIGYATTETAPVALGDGETVERRITAAPGRIVLEAIVARNRSRCTPRPGSGPETATVWGEARKVLGSARESGESTDFRYAVRRFWRQVDPPGRTILRDSVATAQLSSPSPFIAVPLERLSRRGYVERTGFYLDFHAPDARVLLSDAFQERHCFALEPGENGLIGLSFEPVSDRLPDVRGTLWLDRATAELRRMEYRYTRVPGLPPEGQDARGWMEFTRLADGRWIVGRWAIRMPVVMEARNVPRAGLGRGQPVELAGFREEGGDVLAAGPAGGAAAILAASGAVTGTVFDSTTARPLAGARVSAAGHQAVTDSLGAYLIDDVPAGAYPLVFSAARLDSLRFNPPPVRVEVRVGETTVQNLAVPPLNVVWAAACAAGPAATGAVVGRVTTSGGQVAAGARVAAAWGGAQPGTLGAAVDSTGVYRVCGAPAGVPLTLRVSNRDAAAVIPAVTTAADRPRRMDVELPVAGGAPREADVAAITGVVRDAEGRPLAGATVRIDSLAAATTDAQGRFRTAIVTPGEHQVTVTHPRTGSRTVPVPLPGQGVVIELRAVDEGALSVRVQRVVQLAPVTGQAQRSLGLAATGFYDRQRAGIGRFITRPQLSRYPGHRVGDELRRVPGVRVVQSGGLDARALAISTRGGTGIGQARSCLMDVYLDGALVGGTLLGAAFSLSLDEIRSASLDAVEVYQGAEIPPMYRNSHSTCGVILLWSRTG
ncbi:MAG TPA: carboxypeptidase regulatory-like domain-containing protein [Longimicrobium sp.]|nr:carboxypeptidase regulatory-like domain-containing protein [Longimicrobium sp.]